MFSGKFIIMTLAQYHYIFDKIPSQINDADVLNYLQKENINSDYIKVFKTYTDFTDNLISDWLNISVKTFRSYKTGKQEININIKEHLLMLMALSKHGENVFGNMEKFENWLLQKNYYFDNKAPVEFLDTITGIRFVDNRLTAMEYGDNV